MVRSQHWTPQSFGLGRFVTAWRFFPFPKLRFRGPSNPLNVVCAKLDLLGWQSCVKEHPVKVAPLVAAFKVWSTQALWLPDHIKQKTKFNFKNPLLYQCFVGEINQYMYVYIPIYCHIVHKILREICCGERPSLLFTVANAPLCWRVDVVSVNLQPTVCTCHRQSSPFLFHSTFSTTFSNQLRQGDSWWLPRTPLP